MGLLRNIVLTSAIVIGGSKTFAQQGDTFDCAAFNSNAAFVRDTRFIMDPDFAIKNMNWTNSDTLVVNAGTFVVRNRFKSAEDITVDEYKVTQAGQSSTLSYISFGKSEAVALLPDDGYWGNAVDCMSGDDGGMKENKNKLSGFLGRARNSVRLALNENKAAHKKPGKGSKALFSSNAGRGWQVDYSAQDGFSYKISE